MAALKRIGLPDFGGEGEDCPVTPSQEFPSRIRATIARMEQAGLDYLVVYADREHYANLLYLTDFAPHFEEALLLLDRAGHKLLLVGNEALGYLPDPAMGLQIELFQDFSPMGQQRDASRPLRAILSSFGIGRGKRVGCVGWKCYQPSLVDGDSNASDLPAYLVDLLRDLVVDRQRLSNATGIFIDPNAGLRTAHSADQIAMMEYAAVHTSSAMRATVEMLRPGVRTCELPLHATASGLPYACHKMISFFEDVRWGVACPSQRRIKLGDRFVLGLGIWGGLTARGGVVAAGPKDLHGELKDFYPRFVANYFDVGVAWYETIRVGALAGDVYAAAHAARDGSLMDFALNPGHLIHMDEWQHSPFQAASTCRLRSGMTVQVDIIPVSKGPVCTSNMEDGIALADESLRDQIAHHYPGCWKRMQARREFMTGTLGIALDPSVLPMGNIPGWLCPYSMDLQTALVK